MDISLQLATDVTPYVLDSAILLYSEKRSDSMVGNARAVAVHHPVHVTNGKPALGAGTFVTDDVYAKLLEHFQKSALTFIPAHILGVSSSAIAWYEPSTVRTMYFAPHSDEAVRAFDARSIAQPALLFIARPSGLAVYALATDERPNADTPLYYAPYWNVFDTHDVCLGSMRIPKAVTQDTTTAWSTAFFGSNFTHHSGTTKRFTRPGTYAELLTAVTAQERFDPAWLVPAQTTAAAAISGRSPLTSNVRPNR